MQLRFLLGPAGSGKTFRCLAEIRRALLDSPEGPPLLLIAPKQATYQLERELLGDGSLQGYTRLRILSFERLARFIFEELRRPLPRMLDEQGRVMVLRGLLARRRDELKLFRASARLTGFAQELSDVLREMQRNQLTPESLHELAKKVGGTEGLNLKLQDLGLLLRAYLDWLEQRDLHDADCLLEAAAKALGKEKEERPANSSTEAQDVLKPGLQAQTRTGLKPALQAGKRKADVNQMLLALDSAPGVVKRSAELASAARQKGTELKLGIQAVWADGFAEWTAQELELMAALLPHCGKATLTFCLERPPEKRSSWLSSWSAVEKSFEECRKRLASVAGVELRVETISRSAESRYKRAPELRYLEQAWEGGGDAVRTPHSTVSEGDAVGTPQSTVQGNPEATIRLAVCADPDGEATLAAREIIRHARGGGRYRDVSVFVRKLEGYHQSLQRVFSQYEIPYFLDRRESVSHHPLAELTRSAVRTVAFGWQLEDWFAALKTGLAPAEDEEIDRLENEALARGWRGGTWQTPVVIKDDEELTRWLAEMHRRLLPPFQRFALALSGKQNRTTGSQLSKALSELWESLGAREKLGNWAQELSDTELRLPTPVHATVWHQMNEWLENVALAFPTEALSAREWVPILEAGLSGLTVGLIPPALDRVLISAIERSRNPDIKLAIVLGMNETIFPARPTGSSLLTDGDRQEIERHGVMHASSARLQLSRERHYAYLACTRARERLVLTCAAQDSEGAVLNPSPFLKHVQGLFPALKLESVPRGIEWPDSEHASEVIGTLLKVRGVEPDRSYPDFVELPQLMAVLEALGHLARKPDERLAPEVARRLYGRTLKTSVSRIEEFAACPFKFFVHSGLRAEERKRFEVDLKEQGSFQHDAMALFHEQLNAEGKRWRDITPKEARERIGRIGKVLIGSYREGLLDTSEETRFLGRLMTEALEDFVETLIEWMRAQYQFDPVKVELPFGEEGGSPAWEVPLSSGEKLALYGRIDRVDIFRSKDGEAWCVVVDYKSGHRKLEPVLLENGLQLQLLTYMNVVQQLPDEVLKARGDTRPTKEVRLVPAGVFYASLRGRYSRESNRLDALAGVEEARKKAYQHNGRFDVRALRMLDSRANAQAGDQFNYKLTKEGLLHGGSRSAMRPEEFLALLKSVEGHLRKMGQEIFAGVAAVAPYRKSGATACEQCSYLSICRLDPWTHAFRTLKRE